MDLSETEKKLFEDPEFWRYGPTYDVTLCVANEFRPRDIAEALLASRWMQPWQAGPEGLPVKTILLVVEGNDSYKIGLFHSYVPRPSGVYSTYQMSIYPRQLERIVGQDPLEPWSAANTPRLRSLHQTLFVLLREVGRSIPLLSSIIHGEAFGWIDPAISGRTIAIPLVVGQAMGLDVTKLAGDYEDWATVNLSVRDNNRSERRKGREE